MTKAEALQNTFEALRVHRMTQGEPPTITINCGDAGKVEALTGWSKSSVNTVQAVFLVIAETEEIAAKLPSAKTIYWGEVAFVVRGEIEPPTEPGGYWLLPVREA